jgi:hypothetical protein
MTIQECCFLLNNAIYTPSYIVENLFPNVGEHEQYFTSLDLIDDCQEAIEEFKAIPSQKFKNRSTLYIYGVLQSMYCQQDGLYHIYKIIVNPKIGNIYNLFSIYSFNKNIREVRDDIAGHPSNRKGGKEFYFIAKGPNSKHHFTYGGYTPLFRKVDVNLKQFIEEQNKFTNAVLKDIQKNLFMKIKNLKNIQQKDSNANK